MFASVGVEQSFLVIFLGVSQRHLQIVANDAFVDFGDLAAGSPEHSDTFPVAREIGVAFKRNQSVVAKINLGLRSKKPSWTSSGNNRVMPAPPALFQ